MFFRTKTSGPRSYLQIVENRWEDGRTRQRVIATLGRLDQLQQDGRLDALLASGARLSQSVLLLSAHGDDRERVASAHREVLASPPERTVTCEFRMRRQDGSWARVETLARNRR